jgi:type II secretory pathway pseudopilin PulG
MAASLAHSITTAPRLAATRQRSASPLPRSARAAFTFIEVLFAVILLGIGFIMVAAIFPVAIAQTQATANETAGTLVARDAVRMIQANATTLNFPQTPLPPATPATPPATINTVTPFTAAQQAAISSNFMTGDGRFAWTAFYRRPGLTDPFMQVWVFALQNADYLNGTTALATPVPITCALVYNAAGSGTITITTPPVSATEGAFVLITDAAAGASSPLNGRVLRLGSQSPTAGLFDLQPGYDLRDANDNASNVTAYIIGTNTDIALQTSFVRINN